mmetsp:Transcript_21518/g.55892  ORF Transcript_21518/g.55892 Transcript_21518/m.55892 type:complete len:324 (-) Transcript_21518:66-1037(-)
MNGGDAADLLGGSFWTTLIANALGWAKSLFTNTNENGTPISTVNVGVVVTALFESIPTWILIFGRALHEGRKVAEDDSGSRYWLLRLVLTFLSCFGGSTVAGILLSDRAGWINNNEFLPMLLLGWYCATYFHWTHNLYRYRLFKSIVVFLALQAKCNVVMNYVDKVVALNDRAWVGAIVVGTIAGSAGSFLISLEKKFRLGIHHPSALSRPPWSFKLAFFMAFLYYFVHDPADLFPYPCGILDASGARILIKIIVCLHGISEVLSERVWNPFYYLERLLYFITAIPDTAAAPVEPLLSPSPGKKHASTSPSNRKKGRKQKKED